MNKRDWNSVNVLGLLSVDLLQEWIVNSYELVVAKLPKKVQKELSEQIGTYTNHDFDEGNN